MKKVPTSGESEGTTRREALKLSGAAALGGMAAMLASGSFEDPAGAATTHVPTAVQVTLGGVAVPGVVSVDSMVAVYETSSALENGQWVQNVTGVSTRIKIVREWSNDTTFIDWFQAAGSSSGSTGEGESMVVKVTGRHGSQASVFTLSDCTPVEWDGPSYDAAAMKKGGAGDRPTESLSFNFQKITF